MADRYADGIASGHLLGARPIMLAARRYLKMREIAEKGSSYYEWSPLHVVDYCSWLEKFHHFESGMWENTQKLPDGSTDDTIYLEPWQCWIEAAVHGFRISDTGERLVTTSLEMIPRKNAKSSRMAPGALFEICVANVRGAQVPIAAASVRQSEDTLYGMIGKVIAKEDERAEELGETRFSDEFNIRVTKNEITGPKGKIWPMTGEGKKQDGLNPSLALFEEGHAGHASVWSVINSAFGARPNAIRRMITTAGYRTEGPGWELQRQATQLLEGNYEDDRMFAAVYTLDREDYQDPETGAISYGRVLDNERLMAKANPMYGSGLDPRLLRQQSIDARQRLDQRADFVRTRFNLWVGSGHAAIEAEKWAACKRDIHIHEFIGLPCWVGVDLATKLDMCAITTIIDVGDDTIAMFSKFFLPENSPTARDPDMGPLFRVWANNADDLVLTPGTMADHYAVQEEISAIYEYLQPEIIAVDPFQALGSLRFLNELGLPVRTYENNASMMTPPTDDLLQRIAVQKIIHNGNPVLAWNAQNVHVERRQNGSVVPRKDAPNSIRKIDGFVAGCFANGVRIAREFSRDPKTGKPSVKSAYENPDRVIGLG